MSEKPVLYYFNARGKMETIRWLLTVAEVDFDEVFLTSRDQYLKLLENGDLLFQQVPVVEIDGIKLAQSRAILNYIAEKYNLYGKDLKDRAMIDMYSEGLMDLTQMIRLLSWLSDPKDQLEEIEKKAKERYLPVFEKALTGAVYLVGGKFSCADVYLLECTLMLEESFVGILKDFGNLKSFQGRMLQIPAVNRFLLPGSKRKLPFDQKSLALAKQVFNMKS
ncbi:glutathione S-transferase alpha-1-like isoform X1 [Gouania willdenowi]|uniref:Glutathione S-transferase n=1 Tax=Gouania willdenowi TaxID=441366 RepID=A0A8C5HAF1_GOUWI|nr:glutathione S-transferase alpha-1-like isoform X1 [Gouania willdenowi]